MRRAPMLAAVLLLAACESGGGAASRAPQPFGTKAATAVLRDGLIAAAVKAKLTADLPDSLTSLGVHVDDGVVTLRGSVLSAADRTRAASEARGVKGVVRVVDDLRVDPHAPRPKEQAADLALQARVDAALTAQLGFTRIGVHVDRGVATLDGVAADDRAREAALATARGTSGIRNVVDRIRVEHP